VRDSLADVAARQHCRSFMLDGMRHRLHAVMLLAACEFSRSGENSLSRGRSSGRLRHFFPATCRLSRSREEGRNRPPALPSPRSPHPHCVRPLPRAGEVTEPTQRLR
jgi:hypothetical protein